VGTLEKVQGKISTTPSGLELKMAKVLRRLNCSNRHTAQWQHVTRDALMPVLTKSGVSACKGCE
jgi:hypothetical protein